MIPACVACAAAGIAVTSFLAPVNNLPFSFDIALAAVPFLLVGYLLRKHVDRIRKYAEKPHVNLMAALVMLGAVSVLCFLNLPPSSSAADPHVEMAIGSYGNLFLFYFTAILGSFAVILIAKAAGHKLKMIEYFGRCTITCLVIHRSVFALLLRIGLWLNLNTTVITALELIMTIAITFVAETVIERYAPNLIGLSEEQQFSE
jgi:fucose 4-O-acetylase-like acetyltransferase